MYQPAATGGVGFLGRSFILSPANGQFTLANNAETAGIGFNVSTDGTLAIRNRAQSADAALTAAAGTFTGTVTGAGVVSTSELRAGSASNIFWTSRSVLSAPADGKMNLTNQAATAGIGFDVTTDGTLKVRNRAQNANAAVIASVMAVGDGTAPLPSYSFVNDPDTGWYLPSVGSMRAVIGGATRLTLDSGITLVGNTIFGADNTYDIGASGATRPRNIYAGTGISLGGDNGQSIAVLQLTELTTIASAATTDTTIQIPAGAIVLAVSVRVTVAIPTAATFTVGDSGSVARFNTGTTVSTALNTTDVGTKAGAYYNSSSLSVRITPNLTPGTNVGRVRVTLLYMLSTPPTS